VHTYTYPTHAPRPKMLAVAATCLVVGAGASLGIAAIANDDDSVSLPAGAVSVPAQQSPAPGVRSVEPHNEAATAAAISVGASGASGPVRTAQISHSEPPYRITGPPHPR
jgi:hypothetical protein